MPSECPPQTAAFRDLSQIFATRDGRVLEIEILPPALGPFLQDGLSIGITKKHLVQAFVTARRVFFDAQKATSAKPHREDLAQTPAKQARTDEVDAAATTLAIASEIILLFDCEHLTACNWRKTRLATLLQTYAENDMDMDMVNHALDTELSLMTTYLCSPLHRHTKSPTLWQHRLWVLTHRTKLQNPGPKVIQDLLQTELSTVLRAGELHPRNYYAFSYMRQVHHLLAECSRQGTECQAAFLAGCILDATVDWCLAHPTDTSGLMFLFYLLEAVPDEKSRLDTVGKIAQFAMDIGWEGQGMWTFVDLSVRRFNLLDALGEAAQGYPWDVLVDDALLERLKHSRSNAGPTWTVWLDRARGFWADTRSNARAV